MKQAIKRAKVGMNEEEFVLKPEVEKPEVEKDEAEVEELDEEEQALFDNSVAAVKGLIDELPTILPDLADVLNS